MRSPLPTLATRVTVAVTTASITLAGLLAGPAGAQDDPGITTTTQPLTGGGDLGHIVKRPNSGVAPRTPGDPGGWMQVWLFWLICAALIGMTLLVWYRSHRARAALKAGGHDRVTIARARAHGRGPRTPRQSATG
jgi:hypothetical protein